MMRRVLLILSLVGVIVFAAIVATVEYERRDNAFRVKRAQEIVRELQRLEIGKSDLSVADAIVRKFGNAPLPWGWTRYPKNYCASPERDENCVYLLSMNNSPLENLLEKHPLLRRLGFHEWDGRAVILFNGGTVSHHDFIVWYRTSRGDLRGFGASEGQSLPKYEPDQARISDSYSVMRFHTGHTSPEYGLGLQATLTASASATERQRASHIDFACLAQKEGCDDVCKVMPEAWRDFYEVRGRFDVEKRGPDYFLCTESPK